MMRRDSAISTQDALTLLAVLASSSTLVGTAPRQADFCSSGLRILKRLLLRLAVVACVSISSLAFAQSPAPNILIILADDLNPGPDDAGDADASSPRLGLPLQELPLSQLLKPAGYVCGWIGKWHLGAASNLRPTQRGFDEFLGFLGGSSNYYYARLRRSDPRPLVERGCLTSP